MILVNGQSTDTHSVRDRGLAYGDGLFETVAIKQGQPLLWDLHWNRLTSGCARLKIACPSEDLLLSEFRHVLNQVEPAEQEQCVVKVIITRGVGTRGYRINENANITRIIMHNSWPDYPSENFRDGVDCIICDTRLSSQPLLAGIKHLNRLEQVLARMEWHADHIAEGIMLDQLDHVIEGTMSNVFFVTATAGLVTPILSNCGIEGVQRNNVINIAQQLEIPVSETEISSGQLHEYTEAFLTNSLIGIWPVRKIGNHSYEPGPVTRHLQDMVQGHD